MRVWAAFVLTALVGCNCRSRVSQLSSDLFAKPDAIEFGTLAPSGTSTRSVLIRNNGNAPIVISREAIEGDDASSFVTMSPPVGRLSVGEDATVWVVFTAPAAPNQQARAQLVFENDSENPKLTVSLSGASGEGAPDAGPPDAGPPDNDAGCQPRTCAQAQASCGTVNDNCGGQLSCGDCMLPELCGGAGVPNVCGKPGQYPTVPPPSLAGPSSACAGPMPPVAGIPCEIPTPGTAFYVSATSGNDDNDGLTPSTPWRSLYRALGSATIGSTVKVAAGLYLDAEIRLKRPLTVKGGYDETFTTWNPDVNHSIIAGRVGLSDDGAVLGGFRIIRHTNDWGAVVVNAGKFIRNYVELLLQPTPVPPNLHELEDVPDGGFTWFGGTFGGGNLMSTYGVVAAAGDGQHVTIACNDIYGRNVPAADGSLAARQIMGLIEIGGLLFHHGDTVIDSNRACVDAFPESALSYVVGGYACDDNAVATVTLSNNIFEGRSKGGSGIEFRACDSDLLVVATNNTVLSNDFGVASGFGHGTPITWRLTNNVFASLTSASSSSAAEFLGIGGNGLLSVDGNLTFGYGKNVPSQGALPPMSASNDFSGSATLAGTFVDWAKGDFRPLATGPAATGGINVWANSLYGGVRGDLRQQSRPDAGTWVRGALLP